jgi:hypothetical protein
MKSGHVRCIERLFVGCGLHRCCRYEADDSCGVSRSQIISRSHGVILGDRWSENRITRNRNIPSGCSSFSRGERDCRANGISILGRGHSLCRGAGLAARSAMRYRIERLSCTNRCRGFGSCACLAT